MGQAKRRKAAMGDAYGKPKESNAYISSDRELLRKDFECRLPAELGKPYIMNTVSGPAIYVAFYPAQRHELKNGKVLYGNEFRLMEYGKGFTAGKMLSAILGSCPEDFAVLPLCALNCQGTRAHQIVPYATTVREMLLEALFEGNDSELVGL